MTNIEEKIEEQLQKAREACSTEGADSAACAVEYDTLEELQAEAAHKRANQPKKTSLEEYCSLNPDAAECRLYED
jgi:hypothetical protein